jgi:hypothetical protein
MLNARAAAVKNVLALGVLFEIVSRDPEPEKLLEDAEYIKPIVERSEADGKTCDPRLNSRRIEGRDREAG